MNNHSTKNHVLITGGAGFIGSHLADTLLNLGHRVTVIDNFDPFYDIRLKHQNIQHQFNNPDYTFFAGDILDVNFLTDHLTDSYDAVVHLAAKAGVRPSIKTPISYQDVNVRGTQNLLEFCKARNIKQFIFGSSSSVYGVNPNVPWKESDYVLQPISPYASTKVCGELLGHVYAHLYDIRFIGLRFFTVYGPRQRPDLAIRKFADKILNGEVIPMFGDGSSRRDYTFVQDIVQGILAALNYKDSDYEIINLGNSRTVSLKEMIQTIEDVFEKKAQIQQLPEQPGDVPQTYADISKAKALLDYDPQTSFEEGISAFKNWMYQTCTV